MGLLSFLNPLTPIIDAAERAHQRVLDANNDQDRLNAERDRDYWSARLQAANASAGDPWWSPRTVMGWSVAAYVFKLVVWDSTLGLGVSPNPGQLVIWIVVTIIGFYFLSRSAETIAGKIAAAISQRNGR